ncbi:thiol-disulfide oxidoreductase DCC family protein [Aureivirga marina]|uniref:thiol-disulfide oxidoreductase DCC family protein n=1 Tax=Aureivirga marina TaxID=1182451 RepID=UPI0018CAE8A0|nr:thiol-disulfide oxidoreductase DCC family protein [Aureivirga marina]
MKKIEDKSVIFFDGVCNLCNNSVIFIIKRDSKNHFLFAPLQSEESKKLLQHYKYTVSELNTILLLENNKIFTKSSAALRIARKLKGLWFLMAIFLIIPKPIRDLVYDFIAKNRYKWFGKKESCMIPTPETKAKFLF